MRYLKAIGGVALIFFGIMGTVAAVRAPALDIASLGISIFLIIMGVFVCFKGGKKFWQI